MMQVSMVKFLLQQGVKPDIQNELGYSPLHQVSILAKLHFLGFFNNVFTREIRLRSSVSNPYLMGPDPDPAFKLKTAPAPDPVFR
jgi:hypothetical protein